MATITNDRLLYKQSAQVTDCECVRIERTDGTIVRITNAVEDLVMSEYVDNAGVAQALGAPVTYTSVGYSQTASFSGSGLEPGTVDVEGILTAASFTRNDIRLGLFDNARIYAFYTNYTDPKEDDEKVITGYWGNVDLLDGRYVATFNSLADKLTHRVGRAASPLCDTQLGSARCGVNLDVSAWAATTAYTDRSALDAKIGDIIKPTSQNGFYFKCTTAGTSGGTEPTWDLTLGNTTVDGTAEWETIYPFKQVGEVTSITSRVRFADIDRTETDDYWTNGFITFTTGNNAGFSCGIKQNIQSSNELILKNKPPFDFTVGDDYEITVGCRKRHIEDCVDKFENVYNFQGFPTMPGRGVAGKYGGQF